MDFWGTFWSTMWGALAGAVVGALGAWLFSLDLRRRSNADRKSEREQDALDRRAEREEASRVARESFDLEREAIYRDRMDAQFEAIVRAVHDYQRITGAPSGRYVLDHAHAAWSGYMRAIDAASIRAQGGDHAVVVGLRQYSQVPARENESISFRLSLFMSLVASWRRGELTHGRVIAGFHQSSFDAPDGDWPPYIEDSESRNADPE